VAKRFPLEDMIHAYDRSLWEAYVNGRTEFFWLKGVWRKEECTKMNFFQYLKTCIVYFNKTPLFETLSSVFLRGTTKRFFRLTQYSLSVRGHVLKIQW
jgi:hypothetical protein